ncbi:MAG: hypothetical protein GY755_22130, partial [Chloroflexi bacterium]|nr:hypothetical protein [Chloroflexota bacterium]
MDGSANEFISIEGLGLKIEEGTFSGNVQVGITGAVEPATLAPMVEGYQRLKTFAVDFGGKTPLKPFKLSIPVPPGVTAESQVFIAKEVELLGEKKLMILDSTSIKNGRIETNSPPWPGCTAEGIYTMMLNQSLQLAFITGLTGAPGCAASAMDMTFIVGQDRRFIMPVPINRDFTLTIKDTDTGETLYEKQMPGPTSIGQAFDFGKVSDDEEPAWIKDSTGVATLSFAVGAQKVESRGITITPNNASNSAEIESILIEGKEGTTVISGENDLPGKVRLFKLKKVEVEGNKPENKYVPVDSDIAVDIDGSFSGSVDARK